MLTERGERIMTTRLKGGQLFGRHLVNRHLSDLVLSLTEYGPHQKAPNHAHELAYFCLLIDGSYQERTRTKSRDFQPFSVAFHPPEEAHQGTAGRQGARCFHLELGPNWLEKLAYDTSLPQGFADFMGGEIVWLATRLYYEFNQADPSPLILEGLVLELLGHLERHAQSGPNIRPPDWLKQITELLREELAHPPSLTNLAETAQVHPVHLARTFRRFHGQSPGEFHQQLRIRSACRLLAQNNLALADLAVSLGFSDQSHFTRTFRKWTGRTPAAFRAATQNI